MNSAVRSLIVLLLGWGLLLGGGSAAAQAQEPEVLTRSLQIFEDESGSLAWRDVVGGGVDARFHGVPTDAEVINLGYSKSAFWVRVSLHNATDLPQERLLELGYNRLSLVDFYGEDGNGGWTVVHTGNLRPFETRVLANRHFVWPVQIPAQGRRTVYLRLESSSPIFIPLRWWSVPAFHAYERSAYAYQALYYGMALAMVAFNLLLFMALRERAYIYYVGFVASMALSIAVRTGLAKQYFAWDAQWWWESSSFLSNSLACVMFLVFMRQMLHSKQQLPAVDRWTSRILGLHLILPLFYVAYYRAFAIPMIWVYVATLVFILGSGIYGAWRRLRAAYFFVAAFAILFMTAVMNSLTSLGLLPANIITNNLLQFGSACEMVLLAFALTDRINVLRQEKVLAQGEMLAAQSELVTALQDSERALEARVLERTNELQALNRKLEALSTTDGLTGIANRRKFDEALETEWRRAMRSGTVLSVGLIDIDWFKQYNDLYGHQAGDVCLRAVAQALAGSLARAQDLVARFGGEEFAFVAPDTAPEDIRKLAEKICENVRALGLVHRGSEFGSVTVTVGVASGVPQEFTAAADLLAAADAALYAGKAAGRNQATAAGD